MSRTRFRKILIANRGEIALRIARACGNLGIPAAAIYAESDARALHVRSSDEAVLIDSPRAYLNIERIVDAAQRLGADAIHPALSATASALRSRG